MYAHSMSSEYIFIKCKRVSQSNFAFVEIPFNHMIHVIIIIICGYLNSDLFCCSSGCNKVATEAISHTQNQCSICIHTFSRLRFIHSSVRIVCSYRQLKSKSYYDTVRSYTCTHHRESTAPVCAPI